MSKSIREPVPRQSRIVGCASAGALYEVFDADYRLLTDCSARFRSYLKVVIDTEHARHRIGAHLSHSQIRI
jgi:hypothetical protein